MALRDQATIKKCALLLFENMEALTTKLWSNINKKKENAKKGAKIKEFLGIHKIDSINKKLDNAMEVKGEDATTVNNIIDKRIDKKISKAKANEKKREAKNSLGDGKTQLQAPTKLVGMAQEMQTTLGSTRALPQRRHHQRDQKQRGGGRQNKSPRVTTTNGTTTTCTTIAGKTTARGCPRYEHEEDRPRSILNISVRFRKEDGGRVGPGHGRGCGRGHSSQGDHDDAPS